jgi:acyl-CoA thioesterase-1
MRRVTFVPILAFLFALTGCRSSDRSHETPQTASAPQNEPAVPEVPSIPANDLNADPRPRIVCFGDSLTAGYGTEAGQTYPDYLQKALERESYKYRVVNAGISGNTTKDGVERLPRVLALKPALVVVEFGGNDGLRGLRIADTRANLDSILSTLVASGTKVVIAGITLPPDYGPDYIRQFNETYTSLASKYKVPIIPFLLKGVYGVDGMMQADRTHATAEGNRIVAKNVLSLIQPLLKKTS